MRCAEILTENETMDNTQLAERPQTTTKPNALMALANRLSISPERLQETLKKTVFKNCKTDEEFAVLVAVSNEYELNPLTKQIYAFPAKGGGIEPIVSIDGWLKIINSQPNFDGMKIEVSKDGSEATCTIHVKGRSHPTIITEYLEECKRPTEPWKTMPKRMLRHKAVMQCGRVAFGICGVYDEDEAKDIGMRDVTNSVEKPEPLEASPQLPVASSQLPAQQETESTTSQSADTTNVKIISVVVTEGKRNNGQPWTRYRVTMTDSKNEITAATFSKTVGENASNLKDQMAVVELSKEEKGLLLVSCESLEISTEGGIA